MKRVKITAIVLSMAFLLSVVSANKSRKVYADEVEETTEITEETVVSQEASDANAEGIALDETNFPDYYFRLDVYYNFDVDRDGFLSEAEIERGTYLNIGNGPSEITSVKGIEFLTNLSYFDISSNRISSMDLSQNTSLVRLFCQGCNLSELDLSHCKNLIELDCSDNALTSLDVSCCESIQHIKCAHNQLNSINLSGCGALQFLTCNDNQLTKLDISDSTSIQGICCNNNNLASIDVSNNPTIIKNLALGSLSADQTTVVILGLPENTPDPDPVVDEKPVAEEPETVATIDMFRLYNPNSGEHFFTSSAGERDLLVSAGWTNEGIGWKAPVTSNTPVYRLYNPNGGEHHYTTSVAEKNNLVAMGWNDEGIGWYSDDACGVAVYRQYNPNSFSNNHNYSVSASEDAWLVSLGWKSEGVAWYGVA